MRRSGEQTEALSMRIDEIRGRIGAQQRALQKLRHEIDALLRGLNEELLEAPRNQLRGINRGPSNEQLHRVLR
jgi:hypothetical protein